MRVAIAGAGAVGRSIARELIENGHQVLLIDKNPSSIRPERVPNAEWLLADSCELSSLAEAQLGQVRRGDRRHRRRQGQPGHLAARQDRVRRAAHGRPGQPPQQRVALHRGLGRRRQRLDPAHHVGARRGGRLDRRPGAALHLPPGQRQPGRADAVGRLPLRRHAGRAGAVPGQLRARHDPARRAGLHPRRRAAAGVGRRAAVRRARPRSRPSSSGCSPPASTTAERRARS